MCGAALAVGCPEASAVIGSADAKLVPEPPLLVLPSLASAVGLNEAILLQQVHYRTRDSDQWWPAGPAALRREFPFWSPKTIRKALAHLRQMGLLNVRQQGGTDRTKEYRVDYEACCRSALIDSATWAPNGDVRSAQSGPIPISRKRNSKGRGREAAATDFSRFDEVVKR